jgi:hypothetical protein
MSNSAAISLGQCWSCIFDLTMPSTMAVGLQCVGEAIARRWSTTQGELLDDPNYGRNLTDLVGDDLGPNDLSRMQQLLAAEALKDQRVQTAVVVLTFVNGVITATGTFTTAAGPFTLVGSVSQFTPLSFQVST